MIGASLLLAAAAAPPSPLLTGLGGYWKLDGDATDVLGASNGTVTGIGWAWQPGKLGQAFETVSTGAVNVGSNPAIKPVDAITIAGWFFFYGAVGANARLVSDWHQDGGKDRWLLGYSPDGVTLYGHMGNNCALGVVGSTIPTNQWVHLALTASTIAYGAYAMTTYRNGTTVATATGSTLFRNGGGNVCIGHQEEAGAGMNGRIDEVGIWQRALSADEIALLYNGGAGRSYPF